LDSLLGVVLDVQLHQDRFKKTSRLPFTPNSNAITILDVRNHDVDQAKTRQDQRFWIDLR